MRRMQGQWALVTGASSGIGRDVAVVLAELGCNLVVTARRADRLEALKAELASSFGTQVVVLALDLGQEGAPEQLHRAVVSQGIEVDILVNNAGFGVHQFFLHTPFEKTREMLRLLVENLLHLTHLFLADMQTRARGYILQVGSIGSFQPVPGMAVYAASKAFVLDFSVALAEELRQEGSKVSVTTLCPGFTATEFQEVAGHDHPSRLAQLMMMQSRDVARAGVAGMLSGKRYVVPGLLNHINARVMQMTPKPLAAAISYLTMGPPRDIGRG